MPEMQLLGSLLLNYLLFKSMTMYKYIKIKSGNYHLDITIFIILLLLMSYN